MKRFTCMLLVLCMLCSASTWAFAQSGVDSTGITPIVTDPSQVEPLRVAYLRKTSNVLPGESNPMAIKLYEATGVPIEWIEIAEDGAAETIALMIAGGDDIDIIIAGDTIPVSMVSQYIGMNVFLPINQYVDTCMPFLSAVLEAAPEYAPAMYYADGHIYGLPYIQELDGLVLSGGRIMINQTWLDALNLAMPHTVDELYTVLAAFRDGGDLNGNGVDDEVAIGADFTSSLGMIGDTGNPVWTFTSCFGDGTRVTYFKNKNYNFLNSTEDGKIVFTANAQSFKETLAFFHKLYAEGMIEENAFTNANPFTKKLPDANYGMVMVWSNGLTEDYVPMEPIYGDAGMWNNALNNSEFQAVNGAVIMASTKQPELACKWLDAFYEPATSFQLNWGAAGTKEDEYRFVYDDQGYMWYLLNEEGKRYEPEWCTGGTLRWSTSICTAGPNAVLTEYFANIGELDPGATLVLDGQKVNGQDAMLENALIVPATMRLSTEDNQIYAQYYTQIENLVLAYVVGSILDGNIDATWDDYCASLESAGVNVLVSAVQNSYTEYLALDK